MTDYQYLYNQSYYGRLLDAEHCVKKELCWTVISGGTVLPHADVDGKICGGLFDEAGAYVDGSGLHRGMGCGYDVSGKAVEEFEEDAVFLGLWPEVWGHCLTDNIRRLWVLFHEEFMNQFGKLRFLYIPMYGKTPGDNFRELLEILGADQIRLEPVNQVSRFRNIILPDECFFREPDGTRMFTREYWMMIDRIRNHGLAHFRKTEDRKLYFTYRNYETLRGIGEKKLERFFAKLGYRIVSPEQHSFSEQLNMLLNCDFFASTIGSVSHNIIFLRERTNVCLIPRAGFIPEYQLALDRMHDLNITYVDSTLSLFARPESPWDGPFYYLVSRNLQTCFDQRCAVRANRIDFLVYRSMALAMNGACEPSAYYETVRDGFRPGTADRKPKETLLVKLCRKYRFQKLMCSLFG